MAGPPRRGQAPHEAVKLPLQELKAVPPNGTEEQEEGQQGRHHGR